MYQFFNNKNLHTPNEHKPGETILQTIP